MKPAFSPDSELEGFLRAWENEALYIQMLLQL